MTNLTGMISKGFDDFVFDVCICMFYICVGTEFVDLASVVLPVKRGLKCVFTNDRA